MISDLDGMKREIKEAFEAEEAQLEKYGDSGNMFSQRMELVAEYKEFKKLIIQKIEKY